ncbi:MAG TPA: glutamate racemase, partial [Aestuariivirgaceae bacterium]|nr:glutamate racemase [Aestuariivirgaceae bacterium]
GAWSEAMIRSPRILLFDSGMGGLTVAAAVREALPLAQLVYAADTAAFPYGAWEEVRLIERILTVVGKLIEVSGPDIAVIACNTASTLALTQLREVYSVPFVGTVPAIKPAAQRTKSGIVGVLATPGTAKREYTQALIQTYAHDCKVFLHGAQRLAEMAEAKLMGTPVDPAELKDEIQPVFRYRDGKRTDTVVLGCTHYPLLLDDIRKAAPWPVEYVDPAPAIARRVVDVLKQQTLGEQKLGPKSGTAIFTSGRGNDAGLRAYDAMGFSTYEVVELPI